MFRPQVPAIFSGGRWGGRDQRAASPERGTRPARSDPAEPRSNVGVRITDTKHQGERPAPGATSTAGPRRGCGVHLDRLVWLTLRDRRWRRGESGVTSHRRPTWDLPHSLWGLDAAFYVLGAWLLAAQRLHHVGLALEPPAPRVPDAAPRACSSASLPMSTAGSSAPRLVLIDPVAPHPLEESLPAGSSAGRPQPHDPRQRPCRDAPRRPLDRQLWRAVLPILDEAPPGRGAKEGRRSPLPPRRAPPTPSEGPQRRAAWPSGRGSLRHPTEPKSRSPMALGREPDLTTMWPIGSSQSPQKTCATSIPAQGNEDLHDLGDQSSQGACPIEGLVGHNGAFGCSCVSLYEERAGDAPAGRRCPAGQQQVEEACRRCCLLDGFASSVDFTNPPASLRGEWRLAAKDHAPPRRNGPPDRRGGGTARPPPHRGAPPSTATCSGYLLTLALSTRTS